MKRKSFVLALGLLLVSTTGLYAQKKGKNIVKAVEAAVTERASARAVAKNAARSPKRVSVPVTQVATQAAKHSSAGQVKATQTAVATARNMDEDPGSAEVFKKAARPSSKRAKPAKQGGGSVVVSVAVVTRENTVQFLTDLARVERLKVWKESWEDSKGDIISDSTGDYWAKTGEPVDPDELKDPTRADFKEYAQAVRDMLSVGQEKIRKDAFHQEYFGGKTYTSALELAEDIAMYNLRGLEAPPCFYSTPYGMLDGGVGYVLEIPARGMTLVGEEGTQQVLDPDTQVIFYQPEPEGIAGKTASVIERASLEDPQDYHWRFPRPDKKFVAEIGLGPGFGMSKAQEERLRKWWKEH